MGDARDVRGLKWARVEFTKRGIDLSKCSTGVKNGILYLRGEITANKSIPHHELDFEFNQAIKVLRQRPEIREVICEVQLHHSEVENLPRFRQKLSDLRAYRIARAEIAKRNIDASLMEITAKNGVVYFRGILTETQDNDAEEQLKRAAKILRQREEIREVILDYRVRYIDQQFEKQPFRRNRRKPNPTPSRAATFFAPILNSFSHRRQVDIGRLRLYGG